MENRFFDKYWDEKQFIGVSVFDNKGNNCGKIQSLCIDPITFEISGIMVKLRFYKKYFISKSYFDSLSDKSLTLNSIPIKPGNKIVNVDRKNIGKVIKINFNFDTNKLESLEIKSGFKSKTIMSDRIVGVGEQITIKS